MLNKHAPLQPLSRQEKRLNEKPWISKCILKSIKTKNKLFRSHYRSNDLNKKLFYKKYLNKLTHIKYLAKQSYYKNLFKESEGDSYRTWSIIGELIDYKNKKCASKIPCTIEVNDKMLETKSVDFLNELCKYFANVGANMNKNFNSIDSKLTINAKCCSQSFVFHEITVEEINSCINNLKNRSAAGLDGINPKFIKMSKVCLAPFLATFFNKCIAQSVFPENFKTAVVTPIPKTTTPRSMNDFRPISLLPILSKIFEKIIAKKMMKFMNKNNILTDSQFGFRTNNSTELAVTSIYDKLLQNLDDKKVTCSIFLDLKKAFDSVDHCIILKKLCHYGFRGNILLFFEDYLKNRKICTCLDGMKSIFHEVSFGVPQGSVLGPILFLLYVNDLPNVSNFKTTLFADDANLNMSHSSIQTLQLLVNQEINKVDEWLKNNKLTLNYKKSNYMIIGSNHSKTNKFQLESNHNTISQTNNVKYLGVFLDNQLSWQPHIDQTIKKLSRACGMIFKLRYYVPLSTLKLIYYSMFHSVIQYSLLNWGRASKSQLHNIKILQNRFLRASLFHDSRTSIMSCTMNFEF